MENKFISIKDACNLFNKSNSTIRRVIREKRIKLTPIERLEHEELLTLCLATNKEMKTATETLEAIINYLKTNISYVKYDNNNVKLFLSYLQDNNYLISSKKENDKRRTYYLRNESMY